MKVNKRDLNKHGIYCIRNIINNKVYIGKSINIYTRIASHIQNLNKRSKDENRHLISSWKKYGNENFEYFVLEYFDEINEDLISERELFWMKIYNSTDRNYGYNLRMDSSTKMIVHEETKKLFKQRIGNKNPNFGNKWSNEQKEKVSKKIKEQYRNGRTINMDNIIKGIFERNRRWEENPELKEKMIQKLSKINTKYKIYQYTKQMELVKVWNTVNDIIKENSNYKKHNIYAVCSGEKPSMYGYIWRKILIDDIVQTELKDSE